MAVVFIDVFDGVTKVARIDTAGDWEYQPRLNKVASFSFQMPIADPKSAEIVKKRTVTAFGLVDGVLTELGDGIIDHIGVGVADNAPMLVVRGDGTERELTYRSVGFLEIFEDGTQTPLYTQFVNSSTDVINDLPNMRDGNPATNDLLQLSDPTRFFYIGMDVTFKALTLSFVLNNVNVDVLDVQYFDGELWKSIVGVVDGTTVGGVPFAQNGTISWTRPSDWERVNHDNKPVYWIRIRPGTGITNVRINIASIEAKQPSTTDVTDIMALAPAPWALDTVPSFAYGGTANGTYNSFAGELVWNALLKTATQAGEQFRKGDGRTIQWLRSDEPSSGVRAIRGGNGITLTDEDVCYLVNLSRVQNTFDEITRVYPFGAGNGGARLTLANTTLSAPVGYVLDVVNNFIRVDPEPTRIERYVSFKDVQAQDNINERAGADALFLAALAHLQKRQAGHVTYRAMVVGLDKVIKAGETVRIVYREVVDGFVALDVDEELVVLEPTIRVNTAGVRTVSLLLSSVALWPVSDADTLAELADETRVYEAHDQPVDTTLRSTKSTSLPGWSPMTNVTTTRGGINANATTLEELADVVGSMIQDLINGKIFGG